LKVALVNVRPWIARGLTVLLVSLAVAFVAALLAGLLHAGGDQAAASAVRGVLWVSAAVSGLALLGQVVLLSVVILQTAASPGVRPSPRDSTLPPVT
jgi:ABC-type amino acid transport system permease subunit